MRHLISVNLLESGTVSGVKRDRDNDSDREFLLDVGKNKPEIF